MFHSSENFGFICKNYAVSSNISAWNFGNCQTRTNRMNSNHLNFPPDCKTTFLLFSCKHALFLTEFRKYFCPLRKTWKMCKHNYYNKLFDFAINLNKQCNFVWCYLSCKSLMIICVQMLCGQYISIKDYMASHNGQIVAYLFTTIYNLHICIHYE